MKIFVNYLLKIIMGIHENWNTCSLNPQNQPYGIAISS